MPLQPWASHFNPPDFRLIGERTPEPALVILCFNHHLCLLALAWPQKERDETVLAPGYILIHGVIKRELVIMTEFISK